MTDVGDRQQFSDEQSRKVATTIREGLRGGASRASTLRNGEAQHVDAGEGARRQRPFTLATTVRLEQALGVLLRKGTDASGAGQWRRRADSLGAYPRRAVAWLEVSY